MVKAIGKAAFMKRNLQNKDSMKKPHIYVPGGFSAKRPHKDVRHKTKQHYPK